MTIGRGSAPDLQAKAAKPDYFADRIEEAAVVITLDGGTPNDDITDLVRADLIRLRQLAEEASW
ncbi:hypothetical protein H7X68_00665 [Candidatus Saccharibacteria bacterium]|nr:hypothetical protein [Candidatus Saccharibacteria bacterium]